MSIYRKSGEIIGRRVVNGRDVYTVQPAFGDPFDVIRLSDAPPEGRETVALLTMAYRAGFIQACQWPEPVSQDVDSPAFVTMLRQFIEQHTPITRSNAKAGEVE